MLADSLQKSRRKFLTTHLVSFQSITTPALQSVGFPVVRTHVVPYFGLGRASYIWQVGFLKAIEGTHIHGPQDTEQALLAEAERLAMNKLLSCQ